MFSFHCSGNNSNEIAITILYMEAVLFWLGISINNFPGNFSAYISKSSSESTTLLKLYSEWNDIYVYRKSGNLPMLAFSTGFCGYKSIIN